MPLLYNLAGPDLGLGKIVRAFLERVGQSRRIIAEWCRMWSCRQKKCLHSLRGEVELDWRGGKVRAAALQMSDHQTLQN